MIVTVFRTRINVAAVQEIEKTGARMYELASAMPGFVSYKDFAAEDGEFVTIIEFDTLEHLNAWRDHPEHKRAQERAREELFQEYHIQVCDLVRQHRFP